MFNKFQSMVNVASVSIILDTPSISERSDRYSIDCKKKEMENKE